MEERSVSQFTHEADMARLERTIKRLTIIIIICIAFIFATNALWLYWWNQYDYVGEDYEYSYNQDGLGVNIIGAHNEVDNGAKTDDKAQSSEKDEEER